ncbi:MAG TPA: DUF255 domain-containing protein [Gemmatimonadales bacterium]|jgi:uncharacterized protein YyaL (SSP411 family)
MHTRFSLIAFCAAAAACLGERGPFTNRMAQSGTSYLARAARQPVRWQPWGRDAFALAAKLDRPVLLYIGSDACRWCAETDRAIYTDPEIGALINALFVPIRVDRDERPDVALRYQAAVERLAGLHGWPLTVFLTSDGAPFFGGTYFPADDPITGRGLKQLLPEVAKSYRDQRSFIVQQAAVLQQLVLTGNGDSHGVLRPALVQQGIVAVARELDEAVRTHAALGSVMHAAATSLLFGDHDTTAVRALNLMLDTTAGALGEDPPRLVRAALAGSLAKAWAVTGEPRYRETGRTLVRSLVRELPEEEGSIFADREAYVIEHVIVAAMTFGERGVESRARAALDALLQRTYAHGWGVRHVIAARITPQGLLQDQVQVASACLAAYQLSKEQRYLDVALDLAAIVERGYADPLGGYYDVATPPGEALPPPTSLPALGDRTKDVFDDVLPGANPAAALLLAHLARVTGDQSYRRRAQTTLEAFAGAMNGVGVRAATFLAAARETLATP